MTDDESDERGAADPRRRASTRSAASTTSWSSCSREERRDQTFRDAVVEGIRRWMEIADERLAGTDVQCYVTPGNDDFWEIDEPLQAAERVQFVEGTRVRLDDHHEMITTGYSNITPWHSPRELPEDELGERHPRRCSPSVEDPEHLIAVLHPPPYGTELDQAPMIDEEFRVQTEGVGARRSGRSAPPPCATSSSRRSRC